MFLLYLKVEKEHYRSEDQTLLTYPEWFLVFSPEEFVSFTKNNPPHLFPFEKHIDQFWDSYFFLSKELTKYPYNKEYNDMINVIGYSTTIEYRIKNFYEQSIGKLSWYFSKKLTSEDLFYNKCNYDYVEFIKLEPWYKFDFLSYVIPMWKVQGTAEESLIRRYERKVAFTLDFGFKSIYGRLIGLAANSNYEKPIFYTLVQFDKEFPLEEYNKFAENKIYEFDTNKHIYYFPRYQLFTSSMKELTSFEKEKNVSFGINKIAGNTDFILISIISDYYEGNIVYQNVISTDALKNRYLIKINIKDFDVELGKLYDNKNIKIEHIFDF